MAALASDEHSSSADKLLHQLSQPGISSVCLFAQYNSGLLTIRKKKRAPNSTAAETTDFDDDLGDDTESPWSFAETMEVTIRDNLTQKSTGMILLVATWTTDDNRRKFDMFPKFLSGDDTEGVNVEERPMNTWCGKDSNNQIFPVLHTFLPSTAQWAKTFVCRSAKVLLPGTGLSRVIKFNTDANKEETRAIGNALARGKKRKRYSVETVIPSPNDVVALPVYKKLQISDEPFPSVLSMMTFPDDTKIFANAMQGWCGFHKVNRNFTHSTDYKSMLDIERDKDILGRLEIDLIVRWMWYFIKNYKTMEEVELSAYLFEYYMTKKDQVLHITTLQEANRTKIVEFLCKSFFVHSEMLFESCFDGMTMEEVTTSINEAWHRAMKRVEGGPRPNHELGESMQRINNRTKQNTTFKAKRAAFDPTAKPAKAEDHKKYDTGLTNHCNKYLHMSFKRASANEIYRLTETAWLVKRNHDLFPPSAEEDLGKAVNYCQSMLDTMLEYSEQSTDPREKKCIQQMKDKLLGVKKGNIPQYRSLLDQAVKYVIPRFEQTYQVTIETQPNGEQMLICRGGNENAFRCHWCKHGRACDHMYRLLERSPTKRDALPRWHIDYLHFYGRDDTITQHYIKLRDNVRMRGVPLTDPEVRHIKSLFPVGQGSREKSFFTCSLDSLRLCGEETYWQKIKDRLPPHVQRCIPLQTSELMHQDENEVGCVDEVDKEDGCIGNADKVVDDGESFRVCATGGNQMVHQSSEYMVPSQSPQLTQPDENSDRHVEPQGRNARDDFLHMYQTTCKFADSLGEEGRCLMERGLNMLNAKMMEIVAKKNMPPCEKGGNSYGEFMHLYNSVYNSCNEAGDEGRQAFARGMSALKKQHIELITKKQGGSNICGFASMPATSSKKVDKRIQSKCSPQKKR